jgi:cobalt/nickel transport system permease protein
VPVPVWLLQDERYAPRRDKDAFLDRSILSFLAVLAKGRTRAGKEEGQARTEPLVKVLSVFSVILLISLARSPLFLALAGTGLLVVLALQSGRLIATVLKTGLAVAAFTVLILLPSVLWGRGSSAAMITVKVFLSVTSVKLVSATTEWASISGAFKRLRAPDLFILVFDIALKYISLLGEFALAMLYALKLRSVGRNTSKTASLAGIAGTLFLKSKEMAEDMYGAMECRGFTGEYRAAGRWRLGFRDCLLGGATGLLAVAFFLTRV